MKNDKLFSEFENLAEKLGLKILKKLPCRFYGIGLVQIFKLKPRG